MKLWRLVCAGWMLLVLAACGGGGGSAGTSVFTDDTTVTPVTTANPTAVQVQFEPGAITNSGTDVAVANITVIGEGSRALAGVPVRLVLTDAELASSWASTAGVDAASGNPVTNASGVVVAQVRVTKGSGIRSVTLAATAGSASGSSRLNVGASTTLASDLLLTLSAAQIPNSVAAAVSATATAVDGSRRTLAGIPITLSVDEPSGGTIAQNAFVTAGDGTVTGTVRIGSNRINRTIKVTATSGEVTRTVDLEVRGAVLSASPAKSRLNFGEASSITYKLVDSAGAAMAKQDITISPAGVPAPTPTPPLLTVQTNEQGEYKFNFTAPAATSGLAVVTVAATAGGAIAPSLSIELSSADVPAATKTVVSGSVASNPSVVAVNQVGTTATNQVEIRALFLGSNNEPVQNVRAWFDLDGDKNSVGGTLESTAGRKFLYSDANGMVRTNYIAGTRFSPKDGVTVRVCYDETDFVLPAKDGAPCTKSALTRLTVVSDSLSISIGSNANLEDGSGGINYVQRFSVQVVDSAGRAKSGVAIAPSIDLVRYYKGFWVNNRAVTWVQAGNGTTYPASYPSGTAVPASVLKVGQDTTFPVPTACDNEDLNRNGASESYPDQIEGAQVPEDQNNSLALGRPALDPRKADVTISVVGSDTTNTDGVVVLKIEYPKNIASWVRYRILVSASVAGSEGRAVYDDDLLVLAADISNLQVAPPFRVSPYGLEASQAYPRQIVGGDVQYICTNPN